MSKKLMIALGVLVVLAGMTLVQLNAREAEDSRGADISVELPKMEKDSIDRLEVKPPEKEAVTLVKDPSSEEGKGWKVSAPVEAKAATTALETALGKLAGLEVTAVAATRKENHELLEVTQDKGIHVVAKQGDKVLADLWIGAYRSGNTMVRMEGNDKVAAVKGSIRFAFDKAVKEWRDRTITDLEQDDVVAVTVENEKGTLRFEKDGDAFKQAEGEKAIPEFDPGKVKSMVGTAVHLRAVDFAKPDVTLASAGVDDAGKSKVLLELSNDAGPSQVLLRVGAKVGSNYYLRKEGDEVLYQISSFMGDRLSQGPDDFKKDPPPKEGASASAKPPVNVVHPKQVIPGHP
ncbi:MAG: DUF4340 domain-containing protein [Myxococcales bacterium]|nr:DUF4340 domain-containing protein [Myxococcales bacterium]